MNREDITIVKLLEIAKRKKYIIYESDKDTDNYALNIWGIRSNETTADKYDDYMVVFRKCQRPNVHTITNSDWIRRYQNGWSLDIFTITTNPGTTLLLKPVNPKGAAIIAEGQYINVWRKGFHKNDKTHPALIQVRAMTVHRDNNKDFKLDYCGKTESGLFGLNCHRASAWKIVNTIGLYSAGCQVFKNVNNYNEIFMWLIDKSMKEGNKDFSYTLITENTYYET